MVAELRVNARNVEFYLSRPGGPMDAYVEQVARRTATIARELSPVRTGRMRDSIGVRRAGRKGWRVTVDVPYARHVIKGTQPRVIRTRRARALRFTGAGGETIFAAYVRHPGNAPNDFLTRAVERAV